MNREGFAHTDGADQVQNTLLPLTLTAALNVPGSRTRSLGGKMQILTDDAKEQSADSKMGEFVGKDANYFSNPLAVSR